MSPRMIFTAIFLVLTLLAFGCAPATAPYGASYRQALESQKLNPGPASLEPVTGLDGVAAKAVMDRYRKVETKEDGGAKVIKSQMQVK